MHPNESAIIISKPVKNGRKKRFHSKSRDGCLTCKRRKVRCDQCRPLCWRCRNANFECRWAISYERTFSSTFSNSFVNPTVSGIQIPQFQHEDMARAHSYYGAVTTPKLLTYFFEMVQSFVYSQEQATSFSHRGSEFFIGLVHRASDCNSIVRKLLTAMSSLDEWVTFGTNVPWKNPTFIKYYAEAISEIKQENNHLSLDVLLICCLLSAHCEYLMGNFSSGALQFRAGARLLAEHKVIKDRKISSDVEDTLEPIFNAFEQKVKLLQLDENTFTSENSTVQVFDSKRLKPYTSLREANQALHQICFYVLSIEETDRAHGAHLVPVVSGIHQFSRNWASKFEQFCSKTEGSNDTWKDLLRAHYQMMDILLQLRVVPFDQISVVEGCFRKLLSYLSEFLVVTQNGDHLVDPQVNPFPAHVGLIAPLFFTCLFCPLPGLCRSALRTLGDLRLREGSWNSCVAYHIARIVIEQREAVRPSVRGRSISDKAVRIPQIDFRNAGTFGSERLTLVFLTGDHADERLRHNIPLEAPVCKYEETWLWPISRIIKAGGYQGFVKSEPLEGCCHSR